MPDFLTGLRVLDLGQYVPGPYAALQLADMGADVIKIEPPGGDPMRRLGVVDSDGLSPLYKVMNGGKRVVELDLKSSNGKTAFERFLAVADVLVESYRPGVMDRLGFDRARLGSLNAGLIHCAITGWGQTGPYRLKANHDLNCMALGGGLIGSGVKEAPVVAWPPTSDYASGIQAAAAICGALLRRGRTGQGAFLDISMAETVLAWQSGGLTAALRPEIEPHRGCNLLNGGAACYGIYRTKDGRFLTLGNLEEKFWIAFADAAGHPEWGPRQWDPMPQTDLIAEVQAVVEQRSLDEWTSILEAVDTCFHAVLDFGEIPQHPQILARATTARRDDPSGVTVEALFPAWVDGVPPTERPSVALNDASLILAEWTDKTRQS